MSLRIDLGVFCFGEGKSRERKMSEGVDSCCSFDYEILLLFLLSLFLMQMQMQMFEAPSPFPPFLWPKLAKKIDC